MDLNELVRRNRSYRRFDESFTIDAETLRGLVDLARYSPSAANRQPMKFVLSGSREWNGRIFDTLTWATDLKNQPGPEASERPGAFIVILLDKRITFDGDIDAGITAQTILLGAVEKGLGGCILANFNRGELEKLLQLPEHLTTVLVIALGKPVESIVLEDLSAGGSTRYYRDISRTHHVPKRTMEELIFAAHFEEPTPSTGAIE